MSRRAILERERRWAPWAALGACLPLILMVFAIASQPDPADNDLLPEALRTIQANRGGVMLSGVLGSLLIMVTAVPLVYLFRAAQARSERVNRALIGFCVLGPLLYGGKGLLQVIAQLDVAEQFEMQSAGVGDIYSLARNLLEDSTLYVTAGGLELAGLLGFVFAMVYTPLWAMRTGLLTRFFATFGMALSVLIVLGPLGAISIPGLSVWFFFLGLIIIGRSPSGGRPPAWDAGEAVPWPRPGEELAEPAPLADDVVEGDATEIPGVGENPHAGRRERAKKRKRKRRR